MSKVVVYYPGILITYAGQLFIRLQINKYVLKLLELLWLKFKIFVLPKQRGCGDAELVCIRNYHCQCVSDVHFDYISAFLKKRLSSSWFGE